MRSAWAFCLVVDAVLGQILRGKQTSGPLVVTQIRNFECGSGFCVLDFFRINVVLYRLGTMRQEYRTLLMMLKFVSS